MNVAGYSPWLGSLTAAIELSFAFWILFYARGSRGVLRTISALLVLLAGYQIFEVLICWERAAPKLWLSRFAFLDVTWLPPVSLFLASKLEPSGPRWLHRYARISLGLAAVFSLWIVMDTRFITGTICEFMYARYTYIEPWYHLYGAFYEVTQLSLVFILISRLVWSQNLNTRKHLGDLLAGGLLYIIPALLLGTTRPDLFELGMPSLMCHFAMFLAFYLLRMALREHRANR